MFCRGLTGKSTPAAKAAQKLRTIAGRAAMTSDTLSMPVATSRTITQSVITDATTTAAASETRVADA